MAKSHGNAQNPIELEEDDYTEMEDSDYDEFDSDDSEEDPSYIHALDKAQSNFINLSVNSRSNSG